MFGPAMHLVQSLEEQLKSLSDTVAGFAQSFTTGDLMFANGTGTQLTVQSLCIGETCINEAQLQTLIATQSGSAIQSDANISPADATTATTTIEVSPIIQINGDNPAIMQVGTTYNDLGATITGPQADLNLGIQTYVNGTEMSPVVIDTSASATDTIVTSLPTKTASPRPVPAPSSSKRHRSSRPTTPQQRQQQQRKLPRLVNNPTTHC